MNKNKNTPILGPAIAKKFVILLNIIVILAAVDLIFFQYVNPLITVLTCIAIPTVCFIIYFLFRKNFKIYDGPEHLDDHEKNKLNLDTALITSTMVLILFSLSSVKIVFSKSFIIIIVVVGLVIMLIPFFFLKKRYISKKSQIFSYLKSPTFSFLVVVFLYILGVIISINSTFGNSHLNTSLVMVKSIKKETRKFIFDTYTANVKTDYNNKVEYPISKDIYDFVLRHNSISQEPIFLYLVENNGLLNIKYQYLEKIESLEKFE